MTLQSMKALNYAGPYTVRVDNIDVPKLEHPDDIIVKVTSVRLSVLILSSHRLIVLRLLFADLTCSRFIKAYLRIPY